MTLEEQLQKLAAIGLPLSDGVTVDDLLYSFDRASYERKPFDLLLFILGAEVERAPWGRPVCARAWNFDTECIYDSGAYVRIVERLCRVAGAPDRLTDIRDHVDLDAGEAWLEYRVDGRVQRWTVEVNRDWADLMTVYYVMEHLERDGHRFYYKDNGQAMVLFYLDEAGFQAIEALAPGVLQRVLSA